jgi:hypothetical protein
MWEAHNAQAQGSIRNDVQSHPSALIHLRSTVGSQRRQGLVVLLVLGVIATVMNTLLRETTFLKYTMSLQEQLSQIRKAKEFEKELMKTRTKKKPDIAIISSFVSSSQWNDKGFERLDELSLDQLVNKACYAKRWGYDFIFNMTYGFIPEQDNPKGKAYWQEYGAWSRVPHIRDRIEDYKWVLYADIDYIIANMSFPMEQFLHEWKSYNKTPSVLMRIFMCFQTLPS